MLHQFNTIETSPTINDVCYDTLQLGKIIASSYQPDIIIGVSRGGLIPAVFLSHFLKIPMIPVSFSGSQGQGDKKFTEIEVLPEIDKNLKILIVDDICDSGDTITKMIKYYNRQKNIVESAVLYYKDLWPHLAITDKKHGYIPSFFCHRIGDHTGWMTFPWENSQQVILNLMSNKEV